MKIALLIALAGACGTLLRYGIYKLMSGISALPWATLTVNLLGAFAAGVIYVLSRSKFPEYERYFPVIMIGFLGAFTTFSTLALECARFWDEAQYGKFLLNILLQNSGGIIAALGGMALARLLTA